MCGIYFSYSYTDLHRPSEELLHRLRSRGPDHCQSFSQACAQRFQDPADGFWFLTSTVLSLRGEGIAKQPFFDSQSGSYLCWNGEAWAIDAAPVINNDTEQVFKRLLEANRAGIPKNESREPDQAFENIVNVLKSIKGPYAFVFFDSRTGRVIFGRDILGRRSLAFKKEGTDSVQICSIVDPDDSEGWQEVDSNQLCTIDFDSTNHLFHLMKIDRVNSSQSQTSRVCRMHCEVRI